MDLSSFKVLGGYLHEEVLFEAFWKRKCEEPKFTQTPNEDQTLLNIAQAPRGLCGLCIGGIVLPKSCVVPYMGRTPGRTKGPDGCAAFVRAIYQPAHLGIYISHFLGLLKEALATHPPHLHLEFQASWGKVI